MIVRRLGGLTEFVPSPQEKRESLVRDHSFNLIESLHLRLKRLEEERGLPLEETEACTAYLDKIERDESQNNEIYNCLIAGGTSGY